MIEFKDIESRGKYEGEREGKYEGERGRKKTYVEKRSGASKGSMREK